MKISIKASEGPDTLQAVKTCVAAAVKDLAVIRTKINAVKDGHAATVYCATESQG